MSKASRNIPASAQGKSSNGQEMKLSTSFTTASRKRERLALMTSGQTQLDDVSSEVDAKTEDSFWKKKYNALIHEKSELERDLEQKVSILSERETELEKYIQKLEEKLHKKTTGHSSNHDLEQILEIHEHLTGMTVNRIDERENSFVCSVRNHVKRRATRFIITVEQSSTEEKDGLQLEFEPITNVDMLPEYLHNVVSFEYKMAPVLMGDILQGLYDDPESQGDGTV